MLKLFRYTELLFGNAGKFSNRFASFLYYLRVGKEHGYPACCVMHFSWTGGIRNQPPAFNRGVVYPDTEQMHVPCGFHQLVNPTWVSFRQGSWHQLTLFEE